MGMSLDGMGLNSDISLTTFLVSEMHYTYTCTFMPLTYMYLFVFLHFVFCCIRSPCTFGQHLVLGIN